MFDRCRSLAVDLCRGINIVASLDVVLLAPHIMSAIVVLKIKFK